MIESQGTGDVYQAFEQASGVSHQLTERPSFRLHPQDHLKPPRRLFVSPAIYALSPADFGIQQGWESRLFGDPFHASFEGGRGLFPPSSRKEAFFASSFCLVRIQTHLLIRAQTQARIRGSKANRVGGAFSKPFCTLIASAKHRSGNCEVCIRF